MRTAPFTGYLNAFPRQYRKATVARVDLPAFDFPVPASLIDACIRAAAPDDSPRRVLSGGRVGYDVVGLIRLVRQHSIPDRGLYFRKPVRPAVILAHDANSVTVAAAFMQADERHPGKGQLCYVCPFCGCIHFHGTGKAYGSGDGSRVPHCTCEPEHCRQDAQALLKTLSPNWQIVLHEVESPYRAGDFPTELSVHLRNRKPPEASA